jgi:hypothetical protein
MMLRVGNDIYQHKSGKKIHSDEPFPYPNLPYELTTWGDWKAAHPETSVYAGDGVQASARTAEQ